MRCLKVTASCLKIFPKYALVGELAGTEGGVFLPPEGRRQGFLLWEKGRGLYQSFESQIPRKKMALESGTVFCGRDFMAKTVDTECHSQ